MCNNHARNRTWRTFWTISENHDLWMISGGNQEKTCNSMCGCSIHHLNESVNKAIDWPSIVGLILIKGFNDWIKWHLNQWIQTDFMSKDPPSLNSPRTSVMEDGLWTPMISLLLNGSHILGQAVTWHFHPDRVSSPVVFSMIAWLQKNASAKLQNMFKSG